MGLLTWLCDLLMLDVSPLPELPPKPAVTPPPQRALHAEQVHVLRSAVPFGGPTAIVTIPLSELPTAGDPIRIFGEPYRLEVIDGQLWGLPLRTDAVQPVTAQTQRLQRACTVCGEALAPDAVFCVGCGQDVALMAFE
jgi:hypothetical protein